MAGAGSYLAPTTFGIESGTDIPPRSRASLQVGRQRRAPNPVDAFVGVGHPLMPVEHVARGLARLATKGVRTAKVLVMGGVPVVVTKALPEGVHAMMLADRIEAVRTDTGMVVATVARDAFPPAVAAELFGTGAPGRLNALDAAKALIGA